MSKRSKNEPAGLVRPLAFERMVAHCVFKRAGRGLCAAVDRLCAAVGFAHQVKRRARLTHQLMRRPPVCAARRGGNGRKPLVPVQVRPEHIPIGYAHCWERATPVALMRCAPQEKMRNTRRSLLRLRSCALPAKIMIRTEPYAGSLMRYQAT